MGRFENVFNQVREIEEREGTHGQGEEEPKPDLEDRD